MDALKTITVAVFVGTAIGIAISVGMVAYRTATREATVEIRPEPVLVEPHEPVIRARDRSPSYDPREDM